MGERLMEFVKIILKIIVKWYWLIILNDLNENKMIFLIFYKKICCIEK